jgi:hypothetical protein
VGEVERSRLVAAIGTRVIRIIKNKVISGAFLAVDNMRNLAGKNKIIFFPIFF